MCAWLVLCWSGTGGLDVEAAPPSSDITSSHTFSELQASFTAPLTFLEDLLAQVLTSAGSAALELDCGEGRSLVEVQIRHPSTQCTCVNVVHPCAGGNCKEGGIDSASPATMGSIAKRLGVIAKKLGVSSIVNPQPYVKTPHLYYSDYASQPLPFARHSFDVVFSQTFAQRIRSERELPRVFSEVARVLRPGGLAVLETVTGLPHDFRPSWWAAGAQTDPAAWQGVPIPSTWMIARFESGPGGGRAHTDRTLLQLDAVRVSGGSGLCIDLFAYLSVPRSAALDGRLVLLMHKKAQAAGQNACDHDLLLAPLRETFNRTDAPVPPSVPLTSAAAGDATRIDFLHSWMRQVPRRAVGQELAHTAVRPVSNPAGQVALRRHGNGHRHGAARDSVAAPAPAATHEHDACIVRFLGNDLPPRHAHNQTLINTKYLMQSESPRTRVWMLNRIVDKDRAAQLKVLLAGETVQDIPFVDETFLGLKLPLDHDFKHVALEDPHTAYITNNNGGRNAAVESCPHAQRWVCPFDANVFIPPQWQPCTTGELCLVPMSRMATLAEGDEGATPSEPQICFDKTSSLRFQEELPYGVRPKTTFFDNICYHGPWSIWWLKSYSQRLNAHRCSISGVAPPATDLGVYRLPDHTDDANAMTSGVYRGKLRKEGVKTLVLAAWRRSLARRMGSPLYIDRVRLAALRSRMEYSGYVEALLLEADALLDRPVLPPLDRFYVSGPRYALRKVKLKLVLGGSSQDGVLDASANDANSPRERLQNMFDNVTVLAMAAAVTGRVGYGQKAVEWLGKWFLDNSTKLQPSIRGSQSRPSKSQQDPAKGKGKLKAKRSVHQYTVSHGYQRETTGTGCIEFRSLYYMLDAVTLLGQSGVLDPEGLDGVRLWMSGLLRQLNREKFARLEWERRNNHGLWLRITMFALSNFVRDTDTLVKALYEFNPLLDYQTAKPAKRPTQPRRPRRSEPALAFHLELDRADCRHYIAFTSHAWLVTLMLTQRLGVRLDDRAICKAVYANSIAGEMCSNQTFPTLPNMYDRELVLANAWRSICATSVNMQRRLDVSGANLPRVLNRDYSVAPYWNLMNSV